MKDTKVVLIGSFRKDKAKLQKLYKLLSGKYEVLSPKSLDFVDDSKGFVKTEKELESSIFEIENKHLEAIKKCDLVVLHAPDGYVGVSGSLEIGFAYSLGIPVIADEKPSDATLGAMVTDVAKDINNIAPVAIDAGKGLSGLQHYYKKTAKRRGWDGESPRDTMLLLTEEIGELARAVRKAEGLERDAGYSGISVAEELADVQLYLVHLANALGIEISEAVTDKEIKNAERHAKRKSKK